MSMEFDPRLQRLVQYVPQQRIIQLLTVLMVIWIVAVLAHITWSLVPSSTATERWVVPNVPATNDNQTSVDIETVANAPLFGKPASEQQETAQQQQQQQVIDAPETKLQLVLTGVVADTQTGGGAAVIQSSGEQATYSPGDRIDRTRATVKQILPDRVILNNHGVAETLMLDGFDYDKATLSVTANEQRRDAPASSRSPAKDANVIHQFSDYVRISPVQHNGQLQGFRINPGQDRKWFEQSGLQPNDLAVSLNGMDLTDQQQAMRAVQEVSSMQNVSVMVERDGQLYDVQVSLPN